jgi:toxic protein SymE
VLVDGRGKSQRILTLRLSGQWLAELGFAPGSKPHIAIVDGALLITSTSQA